MGKKAIAEIKRKKTAGGTSPVMSAKGMFDPEAPVRERPRLVFQKIAKPEAPKIEPLAKQTKLVARLFAGANLEAVRDALVKRALVFSATRVKEDSIPLGTTKIGGHPDLPAKTPWPRDHANTPLTFLAQIDLSKLPKDAPPGLPKKGLLGLFVNEDPESDHYAATAAALYFPAPKGLVRTTVPDDYYGLIHQACTVTFDAVLTTPHPTDWHVRAALSEQADRDHYQEKAMLEIRDPENLLLGYRTYAYEESISKGETLLFQLSSTDEQTGMEFGDADPLGIYIDEKALAKGDFSKVRAQLGE